jgi:hypothetical protein
MQSAVTRSALFIVLSLALVAPVRADRINDSDSDRRHSGTWSKHKNKHDRKVWNTRDWSGRDSRSWPNGRENRRVTLGDVVRERMERQRRADSQRDRGDWNRNGDWNRRPDWNHRASDIMRERREWERRRAEILRDRREWERRRAAEILRQRREWERRRAEILRDRREWERRRVADILRDRREWERRRAAQIRHDRREWQHRRAEIIRARQACDSRYPSDRRGVGQRNDGGWLTRWTNERDRNDRLGDVLRERYSRRCNDRYPDRGRVAGHDSRSWPGTYPRYPRHDLVNTDAATMSAVERARAILASD